jgi:hypothetical protein
MLAGAGAQQRNLLLNLFNVVIASFEINLPPQSVIYKAK